MKSYVYCMRWADGSLYYGSTQQDLKQRKWQHLCAMKGGYHKCSNVQKQHDAYGLPELYVVQECESEEAGLWCERFFIESGGEKVINKNKPVCLDEERGPYYGMTEDERMKKKMEARRAKEEERNEARRKKIEAKEKEMEAERIKAEFYAEWFKDYLKGIIRPCPYGSDEFKT